MTLEEIPDNWQPPPELGYGSLRPVRLAPGGYALVVLMVLMVAGGLIGSVLLAGDSSIFSSKDEPENRQGGGRE